MTQGVQDLIKAIDSGDSEAIDAAFNSEMATRISERLETMRATVAKSMFATEDVESEVEQPEQAEAIEEELVFEEFADEEIGRAHV